MAQYGTWLSYSGTARLALAAVLLVAAVAAAYAGARLALPVSLPRPGRKTGVAMLVAWVASMTLFLAGLGAYAEQARHDHLAQRPPADPIFPVTLIAAGLTFFIIAVNGRPGRSTFVSAAVGAMAGPMVFELPFDLVVMARTYPPIPPDPALLRALFFVPLFLIEITTLSLLAFSPMARLTRASFFSLALMLAVFAAWALSGFGYPSAPVPIALNVVSKLLAFVTVLALFLPQPARAQAEDAEARQDQPETAD